MRLFDTLKLSMRMFKARTMRTLLTILGMSVGIAAIIFLVSLGYGLQRTLLERITTADALVSLDVTSLGGEDAARLDPAALETLRGLSGVESVLPIIELPGQARFENLTLDTVAVISEASLRQASGLEITAGRFFTGSDPSQAVITEGVATVLGLTPEEALGREVRFTFFPGRNNNDAGTVYEPPASYRVTGVVSGEENLAYLPLASVPGVPVSEFSTIKVKSSSTGTVNEVRTQVESRGFAVSSISETVDQANKVFSAIQIILMIFGMIALIVSAIGMFNTMTIALLERTEEIGIMKAIGASRTDISLMFIMESTLMGFLGAVGGVLLGILQGEIVNFLVNTVALRFGGEAVDLFYSPIWFVLTVIAFGAFVGLLTGFFPARNAARIDALEALRYK